MDTQEIMDKLVDEVNQALIPILQKTLDGYEQIFPLTEEQEKEAIYQTWYGTAKECVYIILMPILLTHSPFGQMWLTENLLVSHWRNINRPMEVARSLGLRIVDAEVAMAITAKTIADSQIFKTEQTIVQEGKAIIVHPIVS